MPDGQGANARGVFEGEFILEVDHVRKEFPGVVALDDVQLRIRPGSVHALMGENGAGKSTLVKVLTGVYQPDAGTIELDGQPVEFASPVEAQAAGINTVYQEVNLVPTLSVAENVWLGLERSIALQDFRGTVLQFLHTSCQLGFMLRNRFISLLQLLGMMRMRARRPPGASAAAPLAPMATSRSMRRRANGPIRWTTARPPRTRLPRARLRPRPSR